MDEFDEATPLRGSYCSRLTTEEYEEQAARLAQVWFVPSPFTRRRHFAQLHRGGSAGADGAARQPARSLQVRSQEATQRRERGGGASLLSQGMYNHFVNK